MFESLAPVWSHVNENEHKNHKKKMKIMSEDMVDRYIPIKFGHDLCGCF